MSTTTDSAPTDRSHSFGSAESLRRLPRSSKRHPWRWIASVLVLAYAAELIRSFIANDRFEWATIGAYLFNSDILAGLGITCLLTGASMLGALLLGVVVSEMRISRTPVVTGVAQLYIWVFRSVPALVLLLITFNIGALYPELALNLPFGPRIFGFDATLMSGFMIAVVAFSLQHSAYVAEIIRGAVISVPVGQSEAATALGMTYARARARIVFPAAFRVALPPLMNELTSVLKGTSIVGFIGYSDLLHSAEAIYTQNYAVLPLLIVASIWYVVVVSVLTLAQGAVEKHLARTVRRGGLVQRAGRTALSVSQSGEEVVATVGAVKESER